ncbi:hypothetical protein V6Z11_D13G250400 [Gossypium hirsutum]
MRGKGGDQNHKYPETLKRSAAEGQNRTKTEFWGEIEKWEIAKQDQIATRYKVGGTTRINIPFKENTRILPLGRVTARVRAQYDVVLVLSRPPKTTHSPFFGNQSEVRPSTVAPAAGPAPAPPCTAAGRPKVSPFSPNRLPSSGCCKPPSECGFVYGGMTTWTKNNGGSSKNNDCNLWNNDNKTLCFECQSCKAGVIYGVKDSRRKSSVVNIVFCIFIVVFYFISICALGNSAKHG